MASIVADNPFREYLYQIGRSEAPEYVWQWFFRYFAQGPNVFDQEPRSLLENYKSLFFMASKLLEAKYAAGSYAKFIKDSQTPDYTYYFIGDTHGSVWDTYCMLDYLIRVLQATPNVKIVWIGDMVDRNPYDLQNLALILSFWILFPNNVFIVRGNHEDASVCSRYGFSQHLYDKAGSKPYFQEIWELVLDFFAKLPIGMYCRVGNKNVWVVHGGLPFDVNAYEPARLVDIEPKLNCFQREYFDMDPLSTSMLWSDPDPQLTEGVVPNPRSGRPRFSRHAFDEFMQLNHFDFLIRGHEKWNEGYRLFFDNQLISLFSTSTYDGKRVGESKFLRLLPDTEPEMLGEEKTGQLRGILSVDYVFLDDQLLRYHHSS
jgi:diadenosine tetraphosphatase ApaH/serine/threonine PP2A family protein phosphatase